MTEIGISMPPDLCACGHPLSVHHRAKSCTATDANLKFCRCEQFHISKRAVKSMNADEAEGEVIVMAKQGRKVVLFEVTSKKADELLDKSNTTNAAIFYRVLVAADKAMTRQAIYEASKTKCESGAAWERLGNQTHDTLARLRKAGFVKRTETREEVKTAAQKERPKRAAKKAKANGSASKAADVSDADIPRSEASATA